MNIFRHNASGQKTRLKLIHFDGEDTSNDQNAIALVPG